ncbi:MULTISPECIES: hypothetical protein [Curtobacterium]|uniref:hypothetical protein n=1 Tax=Curtobacterium TaxID=2034 RepID=UPI001BDE7176|nr:MULTISPECIES: hypothetical protein [Curtobacterium]MBT1623885.1 hypothetical protein [Curtobacterium flaccumfaciens pv. oortii]
MHEDFSGLYLSSLWLSVAMLAGGYARTRNRSAWTWFLLTLLFGPLAVLLLVTWPARPPGRTDPTRTDASASAPDTSGSEE